MLARYFIFLALPAEEAGRMQPRKISAVIVGVGHVFISTSAAPLLLGKTLIPRLALDLRLSLVTDSIEAEYAILADKFLSGNFAIGVVDGLELVDRAMTSSFGYLLPMTDFDLVVSWLVYVDSTSRWRSGPQHFLSAYLLAQANRPFPYPCRRNWPFPFPCQRNLSSSNSQWQSTLQGNRVRRP